MELTSIKQYIDMLIEVQQKYKTADLVTCEDLIKKYGQSFDGAYCVFKGPAKECFRNSYMYAMDNNLRYCEGYAMSLIPVLHAWCLDDSDRVVETTWDKIGSEYFGVIFPIEDITSLIARTGYWGILANLWLDRHKSLANDLNKIFTLNACEV